MTDEELNAQLYQKMADEQAAYREYLLSLQPDEILGNAYEYALTLCLDAVIKL